MDRQFGYAHSMGVHKLYKYRAYRTDEDKARVRQIVANNSLYFGHPSTMDDKLEGKPAIHLRWFESEAITRGTLLRDAATVWGEANVPHSEEDIARWRNRLSTIDLNQLAVEAAAPTQARLESMRLCSFSTESDRKVLWDEYGGEGCGVSLHLRSDDDSPFGLAQPVEYVCFRPTLSIPTFPLSPEKVFQIGRAHV